MNCSCIASSFAGDSATISATCRRMCARRVSRTNSIARQNRPLQYQNGGWISYVMTVAGPEPVEAQRAAIDYEHYLTRQLQPVADAILPFLRDDFASLMSGQKELF